jgi:4-carboxymuconolactone decarboxylase
MHLMKLSVLLCLALFVVAPVRMRAQTMPERPGRAQPVTLKKPRIAPLVEAQWTDVHRKVVATFAPDGHVDNALKTLLNVPEMAEALIPITRYLTNESSLTPRHRELLILRTAWLCGNQFLWSSHAVLARKVPITAAEIHRIAEGPDARGWDAFEATLLRMADQLYRNSSLADTTWKALAANYDVHHLMDAVETVNHFTILAVLYNSFGVQPDEGTTEHLPADVPYKVVVPPREPPLKVARIEPLPGNGIAIGRTFAHYPRLETERGRRSNYINRVSPLMPRYREMLILRVGWDSQAEYEWAQHVGNTGRARDYGLDPLRIAQGPDATGWDSFDRAVLHAADELYRDAMVSDRTWNALSERFDTKTLMSALFTASSYRSTSTSLNTYGVQLEPNNERFPQLPSR